MTCPTSGSLIHRGTTPTAQRSKASTSRTTYLNKCGRRVGSDIQGVSLVRYAARRLAQAVPLVLAVLVLTFILIHLAPGDPIYILAGDGGDKAYYTQMRAYYGLDRPLPEQLVRYFLAVLHVDFGYSFTYQQPVFQVILSCLPATSRLLA